jgi:hypothetical protein
MWPLPHLASRHNSLYYSSTPTTQSPHPISLLNAIFLTSPSSATFNYTILPLAHNESNTGNIALLTSLYKYFASSRELRDASI